jgi:hypothetical protein
MSDDPIRLGSGTKRDRLSRQIALFTSANAYQSGALFPVESVLDLERAVGLLSRNYSGFLTKSHGQSPVFMCDLQRALRRS